jgi:hypothetical protein
VSPIELRLYEFSESLWSSELKSGFARILSTESTFSRRIVVYLQTLAVEDQRSFARALARRWNTGALHLLGDAMTSEDERWVATFMTLVRGKPAGDISSDELTERAFESAGSLPRKGKEQVMAVVLAEFQKVIGTLPEKLPGGTLLWTVSLPICGITVSVDFPPRRPCMGVSYKIKAASGEIIRNQYSFYSALGFLSETAWILRSATVAETAVAVAAEITRQFVQVLSATD